MCKIARFREFARQAQANYIYIRVARLWAKRVFVHFLLLIIRVRIVERFAEFFIVVPRPASAQKSQDVRY